MTVWLDAHLSPALAPLNRTGVQEDVNRISAIWRDCRARFGANGPYLFGTFTIADAMYGPVVFRFQTSGVELAGVAARYSRAMLGAPAFVELAQLAVSEGRAQKKYDSLYG